jgi:hypothetical protein
MCHGFHVSDTEQLESILSKKGLIDGFVFQVDQNDKPLECIKKVSEYSECKGIKAVVNVRLSSEDPAEYFGDEDNVARRIVEAVVATYAYPDIRVFLDTFVDHDRGYFPRIGIYDRRINPRKSAHIVKNLNTAIQLYGRDVSVDKVKSGVILFNSGNISFKLCTKSSSKSELDSTLVDLVTGEVNPDIIGDWILEINQSYL